MAGDDTRPFTAKITIGDHQRGCTGALVAPSWLLTAACFAERPETELAVPPGVPEQATTATVDGEQRRVVAVHAAGDGQDAALVRLDRPVTGSAPIALAAAAPAEGDTLTVTGYGRTATDWAPVSPHTGSFTAGAPTAGELPMAGSDGASVCPGDAGAPSPPV
ncbi:trypsin-like serine protease [Streptomyces sp. TRM 70361]|uniref:trypsin-like serine protease n=1 Tax=Streptomyces sp. TRM 70361 TaxID=3116553 RepID=UPI002E7BC7C0|nr:trypsin-like serine protease [Streptomyces sp. TRM 70361]MEE1941832.1 trypsin-like serine protease [Streptomyces sp. TRM 70361]